MKQTEVGLIPDDWEVKSLGDVCSFNNGVAHENYVDDNGEFILVNSKFISSDAKIIKYSKKQLFKVEENTILMVMSDVPNGKAIAKCFLVPPKFNGTLNQRICMFSDFKTNREFTYIIINRNPYYLAFDDGIKQTNLRNQDVLNCPIAFPPTLAEQQRIAKALSDVDALISTTEKLIQKKKNIKQGTMQNLLTGKKRLPGFGDKQTDLFVPNGTHTKEVKDVSPEQIRLSAKMKQTELGEIPEDWEVKSLGEIAETFTGLTYSPENVYEYGTLVLRSSNIKNEQLCFEDNVFVQMSIPERAFVKENDILICVRNGSRALIGKSAIITKAAVGMAFGAFMTVLRSSIINQNYLLYIWQSDFVQKQVTDNLGATINQITNADFKKFNVIISPDKEEQTAIANVLSSMDKEIETLNAKLEKYRNLKTAMMQQLLTGKIRLVK